MLLCKWQVDTIYEVTEFRNIQRLNQVSVQRLQFRFGEVSNAGLCLVLCIDEHKALSSLNGLYFSVYSDALAVPEHPPTAMSHDVADLIRLSMVAGFVF